FADDQTAPPVYVASVQTLARRRIPAEIRLIVIDECHHASADSYAEIFMHAEQYSVPVVGLTATPFRLDGRPLSDCFSDIVVTAQVADLVEQGFLHAPKVYGPDLLRLLDLTDVKRTAGE